DASTSIMLQFVGTFGVWILAEHIGLSGILTVVVYGIVIARTAPIEVPARLRVPSYAVWDTVVFVLNVMAFLLIGLQLGPIWSRLSSHQHVQYVGVAVAILVTTIIARFAWVMTFNYAYRMKIRFFGEHQRRPMLKPTIRGGLIISWCGMRGIVTLAAALALPDGSDGPAFPYRDLILLCAFSVVIGTLVLQGFTLRPLLAWLNLRDNNPVEQELNFARTTAIRAAFASLENDTTPQASAIRREYEDLLQQADSDGRLPDHLAGDDVRRKAVNASRKAIADLRSTGQIGDAAFHQLEERLDLLELSAGGRDGDAS
ncbi:MAG TPA: cation:proton antiporter, partial [Tepidisphaeraceae bacterium]|nr:cation:proton antiporter [Tepidisphaeraceae bacterium]